MLLLRLCAAILSCAGLSACATREIPRIADTSCTAFKALSYAVPAAGHERDDDPGNKLDTTETVAEVQDHNRKWRAICER